MELPRIDNVEFGPLEYAIIGNGALLFLLFIVLFYTIYRLRQVSEQKRQLKLKEDEESGFDIFSTEAPHQNFSTLCGLSSLNMNPQERSYWSATLPLPPKKSVRIQEKQKTLKSPQLLEPFKFTPYTPPNVASEMHHHQALWIAVPPHHQPFHSYQHQPCYPGSYATLNIPVKKSRVHRCQRAHSCRVPTALIGQPPLVHSNTLHKKLNVDLGKY